MPTECSATLFEFTPVEGRPVVAAFDGGAITSDAGALLLGETDRAIQLTARFAACFTDARMAALVEHEVDTMVLQRVVGIALGYEDLNDHDGLRHDPMLAVLAGKLAAKRSDCAPLAGKSTLNRLELSRPEATRYHKISHDPAAIEALLVDLFLEAYAKAPAQIILDLDATDDPLHGQHVALGFSCHQLGRNDKAVTALLIALQHEPNNFYALKNIGAIYGKIGETDKSVSYLERANKLSSNVPEVLLALAQAYEQSKTLDKSSEIYKQIIALNPHDEIKIIAEESLTRIAMAELKGKGYRFDAVMYCLNALELYSTMSSGKVKEIAFEIAVVGMAGLSINDPTKQYELKSLEGDFSGLQLLCYMFVGFKQVDSSLPPVADLDFEYESALKLFRRNTNEH